MQLGAGWQPLVVVLGGCGTCLYCLMLLLAYIRS
jgi:hypothetical protein